MPVRLAGALLAVALLACAEESDAPPPPPQEIAPPGQVLVTVVATSQPPGAAVNGGGRDLGVTPLEARVPIPAPAPGQPAQLFRFTFTLEGYAPAAIDAAPVNGTITLAATLAPAARAPVAPIARSLALAAGLPRDNPFRAGEAWRGTYTCTQGLTDLVLRITRVEGSRVEATFDFDYRGTRGSFAMSGDFDPSSRRLALRPGRWIRQPRGWMTVGMAGTVDGDTYSGRITGADGCTTFRVRR